VLPRCLIRPFKRYAIEQPDQRHLRLLRPRRERPSHRRASKPSDKFAPSHKSSLLPLHGHPIPVKADWELSHLFSWPRRVFDTSPYRTARPRPALMEIQGREAGRGGAALVHARRLPGEVLEVGRRASAGSSVEGNVNCSVSAGIRGTDSR
jgi:hypothetical protein